MPRLIVYDPMNRITATRYNATSQTNWVATGILSYDGMGRLTAMQQKFDSTTQSYTWQYDAASNITQETSSYPGENTDTYTVDNANQLTGANLTGESYSYDQNGNRTGGSVTGADNRLLFDGTYRYQYDKEGNRTARFVSSTGVLNSTASDITIYTWDYHNRLAMETHYSTYANYQSGSSNQIVAYTYDFAGRMIRRGLDDDGSAGSDAMTYTYTVYDGQNPYLQVSDATALNGSGTPSISQRDLYALAVDQILATDNGSGVVRWGLRDDEGTIRDEVNNSGVVQNHVKFDSFGKPISGTAPAADFLFGLNGMRYDPATKEYRTATVPYDPFTGRRLSEDDLGFGSGTTNLTAWADNNPMTVVDPSGEFGIQGSVYSRPVDYGPLMDPPHLILSGDEPGFSLDTTRNPLSYEDLSSQYTLPSWRADLFPRPQLFVQAPPDRFMPIAVNQNSDWPGLAEINEQRRYDEECYARGEYYAQIKKELDEFNRTGNVTASGPVEAFAKSVVFGAANVSRVVTEPLLIATDTATIAGTEVYNSQSGAQRVELPLFSMSYQSIEQRYAAGESYTSVAGSLAGQAVVNTWTLGAWGTVEGTANYLQTGSPQAMQTATGGQLMLTLAANSVPSSPALPAVLDPYAGSPMGTVPGGMYPPSSISTPYGAAVQDCWTASLQARSQVQAGAAVYKGGILGRSEAGGSQFLAAESPLNPGYAGRYGIPPQNAKFNFILKGTVRPGAPVITRPSPGIPPNPGGGVEGVVNPGDFIIDSFHMP